MRIAKRFRWESAHRLPWHDGGCSNLHGHSYRMIVELEGEPDERGMLMDFKKLKRVLAPLVDSWDHATLIAENDTLLKDLIRPTGWKHVVLPFDTTSENLCSFVAEYLNRNAHDELIRHHIGVIRVRIEETDSCYAEVERKIGIDLTVGDQPVPGVNYTV